MKRIKILLFLLITMFLTVGTITPPLTYANVDDFTDMILEGDNEDFANFDCNEETDEYNFHSLRPYPGSPCHPRATDLVMMCGQDLITKETFEVTVRSVNPQNTSKCTERDFNDKRGIYIKKCCDQTQIDPTFNLLRFTCHGNIKSRVKVVIDLKDALLPIMGNVQDVANLRRYLGDKPPNEEGQGGLQNDNFKMNNYVTWYLNGALFRPEENRLNIEELPQPIITNGTDDCYWDTPPPRSGLSPRCRSNGECPEGYSSSCSQFGSSSSCASAAPACIKTTPNPNLPVDPDSIGIRELINYSGPINKLLSQQNQIVAKNEEIDDAIESTKGIDDSAWIRHDQIAACSVGIDDNGLLREILSPGLNFLGIDININDIEFNVGIPIPCYNQCGLDTPFGCTSIPTSKLMLSNFADHKGPVEYSDPTQSTTDWIVEYKEWRGDTCLLFKPFFLPFDILWCFNSPAKKDIWGDMFPGLPYSSTEDRKGRVGPLPLRKITKSTTRSQIRSRYLAIQPVKAEGQESVITSISWTPLNPNQIPTDRKFNKLPAPSNERASDVLYFPHMVAVAGEDNLISPKESASVVVDEAGLAEILQSTYVPKEKLGSLLEGNIEEPFIGQRCLIPESVRQIKYDETGTNALIPNIPFGDDLYGEFGDKINNNTMSGVDDGDDQTMKFRDREASPATTNDPFENPTEHAITGVLEYAAQYQCIFEETINEACFNNCRDKVLTQPTLCEFLNINTIPNIKYTCESSPQACEQNQRGVLYNFPYLPGDSYLIAADETIYTSPYLVPYGVKVAPFTIPNCSITDPETFINSHPYQCKSYILEYKCVENHTLPPTQVISDSACGGLGLYGEAIDRNNLPPWLKSPMPPPIPCVKTPDPQETLYCATEYDPEGDDLLGFPRKNCKDVDGTPCEFTALTATEVPVGTPLVDRVWKHLVAGNFGIMRIFYPSFTSISAPITKLKNIPGFTDIDYYSKNIDVKDADFVSGETLAGSPPLRTMGTDAKMYFPYLGSIYEHFLEDIQCALRPIDDSTHFYCND